MSGVAYAGSQPQPSHMGKRVKETDPSHLSIVLVVNVGFAVLMTCLAPGLLNALSPTI